MIETVWQINEMVMKWIQANNEMDCETGLANYEMYPGKL